VPFDGTLPLPLEILREICERHGLLFSVVDDFSGHLAKVRCPRTGRFFLTGTGSLAAYPGNDSILAGIARDKAFASSLLKELGIAVPEGDYFFLNSDFIDQRPGGKELDAAELYLAAHFARSDTPLVIKPNHLSRGRFVTLARNVAEGMADLTAMAAKDAIGHIQLLLDAPEFRLFIVEGEIVFCHARGRSFVTGDGRRSLRDLLHTGGIQKLCDARYLAHAMSVRGLTMESVLPAGERLSVSFITNLSASGALLGFVEPGDALRAWARRFYEGFPLAVMGLDVFSTSSLEDPTDIVVTDVNATPGLTQIYEHGHHDVVARVWERILEIPFRD
jgi:D-alanine-D-alanine ligase-like ATP-grasp enzyme